MAAPQDALKVFISYARRDAADFAEQLLAGLEAAGFDAFLDRHDIAAGEDWRARLDGLIQTADTVLFIITPASVASETCQWELEHAESLSKRVLPLVRISVSDAETPERLKRKNYIFFTDQHPFGPALLQLSRALRTNLSWIREHTRLAEIAARWDRRGRAEELLLRGSELTAAKEWLAGHAPGSPEPTALHDTFIAASNTAEQDRFSEERARLQQIAEAQDAKEKSLKRLRTVSIALMAVMAIGLAVVIFFAVALRRQSQELEARDVALQSRDEQLEQKDKVLKEKDQALEAKTKALEAKDVELRQKTEDLEATQAELQTVQAQLTEQADQLAALSESSNVPPRQQRRGREQLKQIRESLRKTESRLGWKVAVYYCQDKFLGPNKLKAEQVGRILTEEKDRQRQSKSNGILPLREVEVGPLSVALKVRLGRDLDGYQIRGAPSEGIQMSSVERIIRMRAGPKFELKTDLRPTPFTIEVLLCGQK